MKAWLFPRIRQKPAGFGQRAIFRENPLFLSPVVCEGCFLFAPRFWVAPVSFWVAPVRPRSIPQSVLCQCSRDSPSHHQHQPSLCRDAESPWQLPACQRVCAEGPIPWARA